MKKIIITALVTTVLVVTGMFMGLFSLLGANEANVAQIGRLVTTMLFIENKYVDEVPLEKLVDGDWDEQFLIVEPGTEISGDDFLALPSPKLWLER